MTNMEMKELQQINKELVSRFSKIETKRWGIEASIMELLVQCGWLSDKIMKFEKYKKGDANLQEIKDELADVLFMLFRIAKHYGIDLEESYLEMVDSSNKKLDKLMENTD